jgi:hypothetical protein
MTTLIRTTGNTQFVAANATSQLVTFVPTGTQTLAQLLVTVADANVCFVNISSANTATATIANATTSSQSIPVTQGTPLLLSAGQQYNNTPGNVYVAVIASGTANVFISPVSAG